MQRCEAVHVNANSQCTHNMINETLGGLPSVQLLLKAECCLAHLNVDQSLQDLVILELTAFATVFGPMETKFVHEMLIVYIESQCFASFLDDSVRWNPGRLVVLSKLFPVLQRA